MKRIRRLAVLATIVLAVPMVASGATTNGTWYAYPGQSTVYRTQVQQPINASPPYSVFRNSTTSSSVIPVKFGLLSGLGPFVFESICSDNDPAYKATCGGPTNTANDYSFLSFAPASSSPITFDGLSNLTASYAFTLGNCQGGSLRWSVWVDRNKNNIDDDGRLFIYYGAWPNFTDCTSADPLGVDTNQSGENMTTKTDLRYDTTQWGGTFYDTYLGAQALAGNAPVKRASLLLDSGWAGDQRLTLGSATVNDNTFTPAPPSALKSTCNLPPAQIRVTKQPETGPPQLAPAISIQPADTNGWFRIVDCKYMYNLATSSLLGPGFYKVEAVINGEAVDGAAYFYLK